MLRYYVLDFGNTRTELTEIYSAVIDCDVSVPADSLKICMAYNRSAANTARRIIAEENGEVVFLGEIDSIVSERSASAQTMKISARSLAALLLDNEAEPLDYNSPSPQLIFRRHLMPFGITLADGGGHSMGGRLRINKGMSHWQVIESFCRSKYGSRPKITADGRAFFKGLPKNGVTVFGEKGTDYYSLKEKRNRHALITDVRVRSAKNGRYDSVVANSNPQCTSLIRRRYVDAAAENRTMDTAFKMIENSNRKSYSLQLSCFGCHLRLLGGGAAVEDSGLGALEGLTVKGVKFSEDKNGAVSVITLEKEWS